MIAIRFALRQRSNRPSWGSSLLSRLKQLRIRSRSLTCLTQSMALVLLRRIRNSSTRFQRRQIVPRIFWITYRNFEMTMSKLWRTLLQHAYRSPRWANVWSKSRSLSRYWKQLTRLVQILELLRPILVPSKRILLSCKKMLRHSLDRKWKVE